MSALLRKLETPQQRAGADAADQAAAAASARRAIKPAVAKIMQQVAAESKDPSARVYTQLEMIRAIELAQAPLIPLARRVATLNPDAGEIGAGMLASLVEVARAACVVTGADQ